MQMMDYTRENSARGKGCAPTGPSGGRFPYLRSPCRIWPISDTGDLAIAASGLAIGAAAGVVPQYPFIGELFQGGATLATHVTGDISDTVEIAAIVTATRNQSASLGPINLALLGIENQLNPWNFDPTTPGVSFLVTGNNLNAAAIAAWWVVYGRLLGCP